MTVPDGTVQDVLDWVGDDPARAKEALDVELAGQARSTLIARLEAIASTTQEDDVSASANETLPVEGDADALAPGPELPAEVTIEPEDVTFSTPVHVRDADVEIEEYDLADVLAAVAQVETLEAMGAPHGFVLVINTVPYVFTPQMTATLKIIADKAVAGVVL